MSKYYTLVESLRDRYLISSQSRWTGERPVQHLMHSAVVPVFPGKLIYFTLLMNFAAVPLVRLGL